MSLGSTLVTSLGKSIDIQIGTDLPIHLDESQNFFQNGYTDFILNFTYLIRKKSPYCTFIF